MKKRRTGAIVSLVALLLLLGLSAYVAVNGFGVGIHVVKPVVSAIQQGLDLTGGVSAVYKIANEEDVTADNLSAVQSVFRTRLDAEGYPEATVAAQGSDQVRIEIPINETTGDVDPNEVTQYLVSPAKITFVDPDGEVLFEGKDMEQVNVVQDESGNPAVGFKLNDEATAIFAAATQEHQGESISILLDEEVISAPTVNSVIANGEGIITGDFDYEAASRLANQIRSGVLPVDMEEIEVRSISATLGEEALELGVKAGLLGIILVMIFMIVFYRMSGVAADIALTIYILIVLFVMATVPGVQLTLPGIAGIILAIGMAVDANVIIFERMREEISNGKTLRTAIQAGFKRAFSAILDGNITTVIAAIVLLIFGTGTIKGFAVTLLIGIIVSFLTAVFIMRGLLHLLTSITSNPKLYARPARRSAQKEAK